MSNQRPIFTVLSIDGGGVRGIIPARILQEIEQRMGRPIAEMFDMVGGSSTGAIIGGCLVVPDPKNPKKPRYSAKDVLGFYRRISSRIFPAKRFKFMRKLSPGAMYSAKPLEDALHERLGDFRMKDALTSFLIPATDIKNFRPVWITHLKGQTDLSKEGWGSMLMRDAVRATTSAPTYFPAKYYETTPNEAMPDIKYRHALIDGSFFGGNAPQRLYNEAKKLAPPNAEIIVVHLGTGNTNNKLSPEEFNDMSPLGLLSKSNGSILMSLIGKMGVLDTADDMREEIGERFFNFDGILRLDDTEEVSVSAMAIDDARPEHLQHLEKIAEKIVNDNTDKLDQLCDVLRRRGVVPMQAPQPPVPVVADKPPHHNLIDKIRETGRDITDQAKNTLEKIFGKAQKPSQPKGSKPDSKNKGANGDIKNTPQDPK